ncbi:MAG: ABC transporter ATP-binding protein [Acidimicrobiales bacterium]|nr:ABC transporter ATP-binding protein [Acidimicrobiales bacterium]
MIELERLNVHFGPLEVVRDVTLRVERGRFCAVVGPSGCGKSTVLRVLAGLLQPGVARIGGLPAAPGRAAFMAQRDLLLPWRRALDNATVGAEARGLQRKEARARARSLFERFGLAGFERSWPHQLSGGMRQRLALLRTFVADLDVLLLDEPFGALDALTRRDLQGWLDTILSEPGSGHSHSHSHSPDPGTSRRTVVLVTHDVDEALLLADEVLVFSPRPATVVARVDSPYEHPRPGRLVTAGDFVQRKAAVLDALG